MADELIKESGGAALSTGTISPQSPGATLSSTVDVGFGTRLSQQRAGRLLNRDGTFNVHRRGLSSFESLSAYHLLLSLSWPRFFGLVFIFYLASNLLFAALYYACGPDALTAVNEGMVGNHFLECFFFSVQTSTTVGYGRVAPIGLVPNLLVAVQLIAGLLGFAVITGLLFARFSQPSIKILCSDQAVVAPYKEGVGWMFRIVNGHRSELMDVDVTVVLGRLINESGREIRRFTPLKLESRNVMFFPLHWTIVHPIGAESPLFGVGSAELIASDAEFLIMITATDSLTGQRVHTQTSYLAEDVVYGSRFRDIFEKSESGITGITVTRISEIEPA